MRKRRELVARSQEIKSSERELPEKIGEEDQQGCRSTKSDPTLDLLADRSPGRRIGYSDAPINK